ncbi:hypothetical protein LguiA_004319 [Lonicera macranthoides]
MAWPRQHCSRCSTAIVILGTEEDKSKVLRKNKMISDLLGRRRRSRAWATTDQSLEDAFLSLRDRQFEGRQQLRNCKILESYCINGGYCRGGDSDMEVDVKEVTVEVMVALKAVDMVVGIAVDLATQVVDVEVPLRVAGGTLQINKLRVCCACDFGDST